jgi:hypothetical protein
MSRDCWIVREFRGPLVPIAQSYAERNGLEIAKMGRDSMSVADGDLKVYGIENLRVADGSIVPRVTTGNTMAPCVIMASVPLRSHGSDYCRKQISAVSGQSEQRIRQLEQKRADSQFLAFITTNE